MDFTKQFYENRRLLIADLFQRIERAAEPFGFALDWFLADLFRGRLPADWRQRWHGFVEEQAAEGFFVEPKSVVELEEWIEAWARFCGLLPVPGKVGDSVDRRDAVVTTVILDPGLMQVAEQAYRQGKRDSPFMLAGFNSPPRRKPSDDPPRQAPTSNTRTTLNAEGLEIAGPGPDTTSSYKAKVQRALETLDPKVAQWWRANIVQGQVRARAAKFWQSSHYSQHEGNDVPVVVVDQNYTAGQTAQAIIAEVSSGWFADSIGAYYKKYRLAKTLSTEEFRQWQKQSVGEAARLASVLAELYVNSIATLTPSGDLIVTLGDLADNGPRWDQLLSVLPLLGYLPIGAIILKIGKREVKVPSKIARNFEKLTDQERKSILKTVAATKADDEAAATLEQAVIRQVGKRQTHHPISKVVYNALQRHKNLRGKYRLRDRRFESLASTYEAHHGYEEWHIALDAEVAAWIDRNKEATEATFEAWLRKRYSKEDLRRRFPDGF